MDLRLHGHVSARLHDSAALWFMALTLGVLPELAGRMVSTHTSVLVAAAVGHVPLSVDVARGCAVQKGLNSSISIFAYRHWASVFMF